jgi:O-antigen ligase
VSRRVVIVAAVAGILVAGAIAGRTLDNHSLRHATSGRSRLVSVTARVIRNHPLVGVGVGSQPLASHNEVKTSLGARKDASHTTPLTVLAELGIVGLAVYAWLLVVSAQLLTRVVRERDRALGLSLAASYLVLVLHSFFYSGFFEDPLTWGVLGVAAASLAGLVASRSAEPSPEVVEQPRDDRPLGRAAEVDRPG